MLLTVLGSTEVHCGIRSLSLNHRPVVVLLLVLLILLLILVRTQAFGLLHEVHRDEGDLLLSSEPVGKHHLLLHVHVRIRAAEGTERHTERRARVCMIQIYSNTLIMCSAPRDTQRDEHESVWSRFTVTLWSRVQHRETHRETSTSLYDPDLQ